MDKSKSVKSNTLNWHALAALSELLALSFVRPECVLAEALSSGEYYESMCEITTLANIDISNEALAILENYIDRDPDELFHALRREATFLFVSTPDTVVSPYESMWCSGEDGAEPLLVINPHAMKVERFIKSCNVNPVTSSREPVDTISTELEFLAYLASMSAGAIERQEDVASPEQHWELSYRRFMQEHALLWMPLFADAVQKETREPFFRAAAELLKSFCLYDLQ